MDRFEYMPVDTYPWETTVKSGQRVVDTEAWFRYIKKLGAAGWEPVGRITLHCGSDTQFLMRRRMRDEL